MVKGLTNELFVADDTYAQHSLSMRNLHSSGSQTYNSITGLRNRKDSMMSVLKEFVHCE